MDKLIINGMVPLNGEVSVSGAKNAVLPMLCASVMASNTCVTLKNIPHLHDVTTTVRLLRQMGVSVTLDDKMNIELDDKNKKVYGDQTVTYTNNSPETLSYIWLQLDQNVRKKDSPSLEIDSDGVGPAYIPDSFDKEFLKSPFDGGFNIEYVTSTEN